jgi:hypothetical protein
MSKANPRTPQAIVIPLSKVAFRFMEHSVAQHLQRLGLPSLRKYREP